MTWQRLSQRTTGAEPDGPYEGVPVHLHASVVHWFQGLAGYRRSPNRGGMDGQSLRTLATALRVGAEIDIQPDDLMRGLIDWARPDGDRFLDLIDGALHIWNPLNNSGALSAVLAAGGSAWTVGGDGASLVRVVNEQAQATFDAASSTPDEISRELREAWTNAFGLNGDSSDAWDHAIKAVEDVLIPVVCPNKAKANLGGVIGDLDNQGHVWKFCLPGHDLSEDVAPLVSMLRLVWPNHDRHGGGGAKRIPTLQEARAVVTLAATIVQWHREGWVVQRR
jgi:hypothetical protein